MSDEPMLVSERWLTNADRRLRELSAPKTKRRKQGLFYALRPFTIATQWTQNDDGEWRATAWPLVDPNTGRFDRSVEVEVFAPIHETQPPFAPLGTTSRVWAVQRAARWELVGDGDLYKTRFEKPGKLVPTKVEVGTTAHALTSISAEYQMSIPKANRCGYPLISVEGFVGGYVRCTWYLTYPVCEVVPDSYETRTVQIPLRSRTGIEDTIGVSGNYVVSISEYGQARTIFKWIEEEEEE